MRYRKRDEAHPEPPGIEGSTRDSRSFDTLAGARKYADMRRGWALVLVTALAACAVHEPDGPATEDVLLVFQQPPKPKPEGDEARTGFVWQRGHWAWRDGKWRWTPGRLERMRAGYAWSDGSWQQRGQHWEWIEGQWVIDAGRSP